MCIYKEILWYCIKMHFLSSSMVLCSYETFFFSINRLYAMYAVHNFYLSPVVHPNNISAVFRRLSIKQCIISCMLEMFAYKHYPSLKINNNCTYTEKNDLIHRVILCNYKK
ncbi:hypothetical protein BDF21DRAFT_432893 [Thamnidium elegans]|nr:hypothetical protein BDF21DRAFT_432893 [Thamnidium elegans]